MVPRFDRARLGRPLALNPRLTREVLPWTVPDRGRHRRPFFALLLCFVASPFVTQAAPADGAGLNPSLQNPYMLAHPPLLYLGYVGLTVPFAFAMAALASGRADKRWIVATRRWTLAAWTFLGVAILLGAKWAYEEALRQPVPPSTESWPNWEYGTRAERQPPLVVSLPPLLPSR